MSDEFAGGEGVFGAAILSLILIPLTINWCVKVNAKARGRQPGEPHYRTGAWIAVYSLVIALGWALLLHLGSLAGEAAPFNPFEPFEILGIDEGATEQQIKKAYRKLSMIHHPDKGGDEATFQKLAAAYRALTDPASRENYKLYGHPDGRQAFAAGVALPEWMMDGDNQGLVLVVYAVVLVAAPTFCLFGGGLRGAPKSGGRLQEAQQSLLEYFAAELQLGQQQTLVGLLSILAAAPVLLPPQEDDDEGDDEEGDEGEEQAGDAAEQAALAAVTPPARRALLQQHLEDSDSKAHRLNLLLLALHLSDRSVAKSGAREEGTALSGLPAAHRQQLELLLSAAPQVIQAMLRVSALAVKELSVSGQVVSLSQGLALGMWPGDDEAKAAQKRLLKAAALTVPSALVDVNVSVEDEDTIAENDTVTCQIMFRRQNEGWVSAVLLTGLPLPEDHPEAAAGPGQLSLARALAAESAARQGKAPEAWAVTLGVPTSGECLGLFPIDGLTKKQTGGRMKFQQRGTGKVKCVAEARALHCFADCSKTVLYTVLTAEQVEKLEQDRAEAGDSDDGEGSD